MNKLYLMVGIPGSGKSAFIANTKEVKTLIVSRDAIRFSMVDEGESYFKKEKEVFNTFINKINEGLKYGNVVADATHISTASRAKVLSRITEPCKVIIMWMNTDLETALAQNALREGRSVVPETAIRNMHESFEEPSFEEDERIDTIIKVDIKNKYNNAKVWFRNSENAWELNILPRNAKLPTNLNEMEEDA